MNILFICPREKPFNSQTVRELPCGGTEKAHIYLGEAFQKLGHDVSWVTTPDELQATLNCVDYLPGGQHIYDVVITQQAELLEHFPNARKVFWSHHFADQAITIQQAAFARCFADKIVTLSQCHAKHLKDTLRLKSVIIGYGVWLNEVVKAEKDPYRLIYASTPFRGLDRVPELFQAIKEREPRATITIASSMRTYGEAQSDSEYTHLFKRLSEMEGVTLTGPLNQQQLFQEYAKASIFFYPNTWPETFCLALEEALVHDCNPFTTDLGALSERANTCRMDELVEDVLTDFRIGENTGCAFDHSIYMKHQPKDWLEVAKEWQERVLS